MKKYNLYIVIAIIIFAVLVGYFIYAQITGKSAVSKCSKNAEEAVKKVNPATTAEGVQMYNISFKGCMGTKGYQTQ